MPAEQKCSGGLSLYSLSALWRLSASEANDADPKLRIYAKRAFQQCAIVIGFSQPLAVCYFPHGTNDALTMHLAFVFLTNLGTIFNYRGGRSLRSL